MTSSLSTRWDDPNPNTEPNANANANPNPNPNQVIPQGLQGGSLNNHGTERYCKVHDMKVTIDR